LSKTLVSGGIAWKQYIRFHFWVLLYGFVSAAKVNKKSNITKEKERNYVLCSKARGERWNTDTKKSTRP
jgi:hypothetical protein